MFTGIIEAVAAVKDRTENQLTVERPASFDDIKIGSSICVCGVCLSVVALDRTSMTFDVVEETFRCTKLGSLRAAEKVNLERAMKAGDRFEGHVMQGHVEGRGCVVSVFTSIPQPCSPVSTPSPNPSPMGRGEDLWKETLYSKESVNKVVLKHARIMRSEPTDAEAVLWEALRKRQVCGLYFRRQHPVGTRILDFYCHKERLGIEVDGSVHKRREVRERDREKELILEDREVKLLRFTNDEVLHHLAWTIEQIERSVQDSPLPVGEGMGERVNFKRGDGGGGVKMEEELVVEGEEEWEKTKKNKTSSLLTISVHQPLLQNIILKGSIALDGVSLTVAKIDGNFVTVALIPHTLESTTLLYLQEGDHVNIETDVFVRQTRHLLAMQT